MWSGALLETSTVFELVDVAVAVLAACAVLACRAPGVFILPSIASEALDSGEKNLLSRMRG